MEDLFAGLQPTSSADDAAAAAPVIEPATPVAEPTADAQPTAEEQADDDEWGDAIDDIFPGLQKSQEDNDEQTKSGQGTKEAGADEAAGEAAKSGEDAGKSPEDKAQEADAGAEAGAGEAEPTGPPELSASDRQELESNVKAEVRERMFTEEVNGKAMITALDGVTKYVVADGKPTLADADGDPVRTIDDVMKLINPRTGEAFTEEQAGMYLLNAQNQMRDNLADLNARVNEIASTGLTLKEESEVISWEYGELLKAMPELQQELWADYEKTLVKDAKTGIVTKAPTSLQSFYERALKPYAELGRLLESQAGATPPAATPAAATPPATPAPQVQEQQRQQRRADRSDIYGGSKLDTATDDDKEWGAAAQAVFGDQLNIRR